MATPYVPHLSVSALSDGGYNICAWFRNKENKFSYSPHYLTVVDLEDFFRRWREDPAGVALKDFGVELHDLGV